MKNPKTTVAGYLTIAASIIGIIAHVLSSGGIGMSDIQALLGILAGFGLIAAQDGGH